MPAADVGVSRYLALTGASNNSTRSACRGGNESAVPASAGTPRTWLYQGGKDEEKKQDKKQTLSEEDTPHASENKRRNGTHACRRASENIRTLKERHTRARDPSRAAAPPRRRPADPPQKTPVAAQAARHTRTLRQQYTHELVHTRAAHTHANAGEGKQGRRLAPSE